MAFNYEELQSVTKEYFYPKLVDQIFSKDPILDMIRQKKKTVDGGRNFVVNIKVDTLNHGKFAADTVFDVSKKEIINRVDLPVRGAYANLTIDHFDETQNKGKAQILNLLSTKIEDLEEAMRQELLSMLYEDPSVADPENQGFIGLQEIVDDKNTYATLNRTEADKAFWRSVVREDLSGSAPIQLTYPILRDFYMKVTDAGKDGKDLVFVGDFGTVAAIEQILITQNMIQSRDNGLANLGFEDFTLFGKKVYASSELEAQAGVAGKGILYALNFNYLTMHVLEGSDFHMTGFKEDRNTALKSQQLILQGNFVATKPKRLGVIKDIKIV